MFEETNRNQREQERKYTFNELVCLFASLDNKRISVRERQEIAQINDFPTKQYNQKQQTQKRLVGYLELRQDSERLLLPH